MQQRDVWDHREYRHIPVPLNKESVLALKSVLGTDPQWCFTYEGKPMVRVGSAWKRTLQRVGITDFRFHDLRYTWRTRRLESKGGWGS